MMNIFFNSAATKGNLIEVLNEERKQNVYFQSSINGLIPMITATNSKILPNIWLLCDTKSQVTRDITLNGLPCPPHFYSWPSLPTHSLQSS